MLAGRPYRDAVALYAAGERAWWALGPEDWREAFAAHPRIGERGADAWSHVEQAAVGGADASTRRALADGNREYEARFGQVFLICATGRSAGEMLAELERRLRNDPVAELRVAAAEQARITRLRLEKLASE